MNENKLMEGDNKMEKARTVDDVNAELRLQQDLVNVRRRQDLEYQDALHIPKLR